MKRLLATTAFCLALVAPALADGKIYVQLPDVSAWTGEDAEIILKELVLVNVVSSNCPGFEITDGEWSLLTDSADLVARGQLGLSVEAYDAQYYSPAFDALDDPATCDQAGPRVQPMLDLLVEMGGSREPLPDQDAAYQADQARQAAWDAGLPTPRKTKTK